VLWASERGARVANLSLGTKGPQPCPEGLRTAVRQALQGGTLVVAAAGNRGPQSGSVSCPANLDEVVAVAATDAEGRVASYSSRGPEVDLAAPGGERFRELQDRRADREPLPCVPGGLPVCRWDVLRRTPRERRRSLGAVAVALLVPGAGPPCPGGQRAGPRRSWVGRGGRLRPGPARPGPVRAGGDLPVIPGVPVKART
jgi:hypothetical protein